MARAYLDLAPELFVEMCKALKSGEDLRYFRVVRNPLPDDCEVVNVEPGVYSNMLRLVLQSATFKGGEVLEAPFLQAVRGKVSEVRG